MPSILNLKFKGNKSFVAFSNLNDSESLTKTWKVCTKVASYLEQGQRLENLSWRLWHLQNLMVDTDNAKSKREFKKLSKCMGDKLDKEKGRSIEDLPAPDFKRTPSTDLLRARAVEKERTREAGAHAPEHTLQRMQFTFAVEPVGTTNLNTNTNNTTHNNNNNNHTSNASNTTTNGSGKRGSSGKPSVRLPTLFSTSFGPAALLAPAPSLAPRMSYGEGRGHDDESMRVARPTIELPLDELLCHSHGHSHGHAHSHSHSHAAGANPGRRAAPRDEEMDDASSEGGDGDDSADSDFFERSAARKRRKRASRVSGGAAGGGSGGGSGAGAGTGQGARARRPVLSVRVPARGAGGGGGGVGQVLSASSAGANNNSAPGGVKAECSNCGATHTPLWRRGLNDELNCNACGLYCKLHKRPRPKTMRASGGGVEGRGQSVRAEAMDVMAQCYNCHTTATPLWRKDDEGKTVCNACGLYYKLHGSARPISMKSDVIRKRSRHDARRGGASVSVETPTASPGVSRRASPAPGGHHSSASASTGRASPTLAPDSTTTTHTYETPSELASALGTSKPPSSFVHPYPFHDQYPDALPFASVDVGAAAGEARGSKRRRMSVDSASEPPSSATSYASYADGYTSGSSQFSMEFPFSRFPTVGNSPNSFLHPPMLPNSEDAPMDYLHPPMVRHHNSNGGGYGQQSEEESLNSFFSGFMQGNGLHPPMLPGDMGMGMMHPPMMPYEDVYDSNGNLSMHY
ncbi:hypothetical protein B0H15DRAFT_777423 [Mycena belliarum]|uniref:GATA-type domain-containing protein n=1 Tax=Mycena belliarum TaxID=1033014 RepID=A0AAD6UBV2_9AGAR|nr:hypothetical protein B0H15DRAFT_777423 [Mycena belliae]